ncbi:MAG: hypothetical protein Q9N34_09545, partial [Aquificota bacterium]|nr:hypothetical protein [Aquificota bacterium]
IHGDPPALWLPLGKGKIILLPISLGNYTQATGSINGLGFRSLTHTPDLGKAIQRATPSQTSTKPEAGVTAATPAIKTGHQSKRGQYFGEEATQEPQTTVTKLWL